jgi:hypothetical protein
MAFMSLPRLLSLSWISLLLWDNRPRASLLNCYSARRHLASPWLDLAEDRLRLDRLNRNASGPLSSPGLKPIPRETRKSPRLRPPLRSGPRAGASSILLGIPIAIEATVVAARNSTGE